MAVQGHPRLQAKRVAAGQPGGNQAELLAGGHEGTPQRFRFRRVDVQFEAVLAGVAGPPDEHGALPEPGGGRPVVLEVGEALSPVPMTSPSVASRMARECGPCTATSAVAALRSATPTLEASRAIGERGERGIWLPALATTRKFSR